MCHNMTAIMDILKVLPVKRLLQEFPYQESLTTMHAAWLLQPNPFDEFSYVKLAKKYKLNFGLCTDLHSSAHWFLLESEFLFITVTVEGSNTGNIKASQFTWNAVPNTIFYPPHSSAWASKWFLSSFLFSPWPALFNCFSNVLSESRRLVCQKYYGVAFKR
jgi:hypothetical protein